MRKNSEKIDINFRRTGTLRRESSCQTLSQKDLSDTASVGFEAVQLKCGRQTKFQNARNAASAGTGCECKNLAGQKKCIFCRLESNLLSWA